MNLHYLKTLLLVAECKSLTEAAARLEISQPAVTKQIKVMEEKLNLKLIKRGRQQLELTEAGLLLELYGQQLLKIWEQARLDLFRLQLGSYSQQSQLFCPNFKFQFCQWLENRIIWAFSGIKMAVLPENPKELQGSALLLTDDDISGLSGYKREVVYQDRLVLLASKELAISNLRHVQLSELSRYQIITLAEYIPYMRCC